MRSWNDDDVIAVDWRTANHGLNERIRIHGHFRIVQLAERTRRLVGSGHPLDLIATRALAASDLTSHPTATEQRTHPRVGEDIRCYQAVAPVPGDKSIWIALRYDLERDICRESWLSGGANATRLANYGTVDAATHAQGGDQGQYNLATRPIHNQKNVVVGANVR